MDEPGHPGAVVRSPRGGVEGPAPLREWGRVWQLPALIAAGGLLAAGVTALLFTSRTPDLEAMIGHVEALVAAEEFRPALDHLNTVVRPWYDGDALSDEQKKRFHLLRARSLYLGQKEYGLDLVENARSIVDEYAGAARHGPITEGRDLYFMADAHVTLGLYERSLELARRLRQEEGGTPMWGSEGSSRIHRRIIDRHIREGDSRPELPLRLLEEFLREGEPSHADRAWALARQSEILIRKGDHDAAIARLLRTLPALLPDVGPEESGELYLLLGRAYMEAGALVEAGRQLTAATELLLDTDERWATAMVLLARAQEELGDPPEDGKAEAREKYRTVAGRFDVSPERLPALLGLAEVEAALGDFDASLFAYGQLVDAILEGSSHATTGPQVVTTSLLARWRGQFDTGESEVALRYALLAERLWRGQMAAAASNGDDGSAVVTPAEVIVAIARTHRAVAESLLARAWVYETAMETMTGEARASRIAALDAATRQSVRGHLVSAGRYYKMHAEMVGISDNVAYGESLWAAAEAYDLAGDFDASIPLFADYIQFFPGDPRRAEARFQLGRAYQARGEYVLAAEHYRALIAESRRGGREAGGGIGGIGPHADLSMVPLAQVLILEGGDGNSAEAESLLNEVVAGQVGGTTTPQFREGLVELGLLLKGRREYAGAIQRLEEAVTRFPAHPAVESVRYALAEANRLDAIAIRRTLTEAMPDHRRHSLREARVQRLQRAEELYEQVRRTLELRDPRRRTSFEELQLRNSYFYLGDCAFELGDYEAAIQRYDAARERFPGDPATLVAMVQIVNAYVERGDLQRAATANERARRFYQSLPASAWSDPDLPMSREDWQRWLDSMTALRPVRMQDGESRTATFEGDR
jgi:tetratricopeptide (TPR) repeat protein